MPSSTCKRHRMRCGHKKCATRFTLKKHPREYSRAIRCPSCGSVHVYSCEAARRRELARQRTCRCGAYPFPHRAGSLRFCQHHPAAGTEPARQEMEDYERVIATRRSGFV